MIEDILSTEKKHAPADDSSPETWDIMGSMILNFYGDFKIPDNEFDFKSVAEEDRKYILTMLKTIIRDLNTLSEKIETSLRPEMAMVKPSENFMEPSECDKYAEYQKSAIDQWNKFTLDEKQENQNYLEYLSMRQYIKNGEYCQNTLRLFAGMPLVKDPDNRPYSMP
jgi:hypothetical protein